jgi:hypothetical protein
VVASIDLEADRRFRAHRHGGTRTRTSVIVIHSTEGPTAAGAAAWFADKRSSGSTQLIVDDSSTFRPLDDETIAYGAHPYNQIGVHLEIAGFAKWTREEWLARDARLRRAARVVAYWCCKYEIPAVLLEDADVAAWAKSGIERKGITTHAACARGAHPKGGDHWDPGPEFPLDVLLAYVRKLIEAATTPIVERVPEPKHQPLWERTEGQHSPDEDSTE